MTSFQLEKQQEPIFSPKAKKKKKRQSLTQLDFKLFNSVKQKNNRNLQLPNLITSKAISDYKIKRVKWIKGK